MVRVSQQKLDDWSRQAIGEYLEGDTKLDDLVTKIARANDLSVDQIKLLAQNTNVKLRVQRPNLKFAAKGRKLYLSNLERR